MLKHVLDSIMHPLQLTWIDYRYTLKYSGRKLTTVKLDNSTLGLVCSQSNVTRLKGRESTDFGYQVYSQYHMACILTGK